MPSAVWQAQTDTKLPALRARIQAWDLNPGAPHLFQPQLWSPFQISKLYVLIFFQLGEPVPYILNHTNERKQLSNLEAWLWPSLP